MTDARAQQLEAELDELRRAHERLLRILATFAGDAKLALEENSRSAAYDSLFDFRAAALTLVDESKVAA